MSDQSQPLVFTSQQQLALQELEKQVNGFNGFKTLVSRSLYAGQDAAQAAQLIGFLGDLVAQAMTQVKKIQDEAKAASEQVVSSSKEQ